MKDNIKYETYDHWRLLLEALAYSVEYYFYYFMLSLVHFLFFNIGNRFRSRLYKTKKKLSLYLLKNNRKSGKINRGVLLYIIDSLPRYFKSFTATTYTRFVDITNQLVLLEKQLQSSEYKFKLLSSVVRKLTHIKPVLDARIHNIGGYLFMIKRDWENAEKSFIQGMSFGKEYPEIYYYLGVVYDMQCNYREAEHWYYKAYVLESTSANLLVNLAHVELYQNKQEDSLNLLKKAIKLDPSYSMSHQNTAALYDRFDYVPTKLDKSGKDELILYDACNYVGQRAIHAGDGKRGLDLFAQALSIQKKISDGFKLPTHLLNEINKVCIIDDQLPIRLLSYEWVTQIGHIAMLDTYLKLQLLGICKTTNRILLAPYEKISNKAYLDCWKKYFIVITDTNLINDLFQYQRYIGDSFNAHLISENKAISWPDIGAKAHVLWDARFCSKSLIELSQFDNEKGLRILEELGIPTDSWYVCLHTRGSGYHREGNQSNQSHRNADLDDYIPAIKYIRENGGYVIRMGDISMEPAPKIRGLVDYAISKYKSEFMDSFLCATSRLFIGTTSGLTNAVISFNRPCVLVNCISNYSQLWNKNVIFSHKLFYSRDEKRYLKLGEIVSDNFRWNIMNSHVLEKMNINIINNDSDDILNVLRDFFEPLDLNDPNYMEYNFINAQYKITMDENIRFGNANPSLRFFYKHRDKFF